MSIATLDGVFAGLTPGNRFMKIGTTTAIGRYQSMLYAAGSPGAAIAPAPGIAGAALTSYLGQLPFTNPVSGNSYLARLSAFASQLGTVLLCDRLWHNSGLSATLTSSQSVVSVAWPARDRNGVTNGDDILIGFEVSSNMGSGTPTFTLGYTNSAGTAGRSSVTAAQVSAMPIGSFIPLPLQAGDVGVRSVESFQLSASMSSGAYHLVAYRVLASIGCGQVGVEAAVDALAGHLPRLYDNTVPFLLYMPATTTAATLDGQIVIAQG